MLETASGFSSESGESVFRGVIAFDSDQAPTPVISSVTLVNGNTWPPQNCCEGVTLDDFVFGVERP